MLETSGPEGPSNPPPLLDAFSVDDRVLQRTLGSILGRRVDDADLYFEHVVTDSIALEEGMIKLAKALSEAISEATEAGDIKAARIAHEALGKLLDAPGGASVAELCEARKGR